MLINILLIFAGYCKIDNISLIQKEKSAVYALTHNLPSGLSELDALRNIERS